MAIKKTSNRWLVDVQPGGRGGKRKRKTFDTKAEALAWERYIQAKTQEKPDWEPKGKDARLLSELCEEWFQHHGIGLNSAKNTKARLLAMCKAMGNPRADAFRAEHFSEYRAKRISEGISENNMNRELSYLRAVFNELIRLEKWHRDNPLKNIRKFKIHETELAYLNSEEMLLLLETLKEGKNPHAYLIAKICLSTGARWSEAESLRISQVKGGLIQYVETKSKKSRSIPISNEIQSEMIDHHKNHGMGDRLFSSAFSAFRHAVKRAKINLPTGQLTHVLRHTFASHFMMNGGNILALQKILGHHSLAMTMRYAHLAPDFMKEVKKLNPLSNMI